MATQLRSTLLFALSLLLSASYFPASPNAQLMTKLAATGNYSMVLKILESANLATLLDPAKPVTLFTPHDSSFNGSAALPPAVMDCLANTEKGKVVMMSLARFHVVQGYYNWTTLKTTSTLETLSGENVTFEYLNSTNTVEVSGRVILRPDLITDPQGIVQGIDGMLLPANFIAKFMEACPTTGGTTPAAKTPASPPPKSSAPSSIPITRTTALGSLIAAFSLLQLAL